LDTNGKKGTEKELSSRRTTVLVLVSWQSNFWDVYVLVNKHDSTIPDVWDGLNLKFLLIKTNE
jgi:hypothetical protein